jgi:hypothetical protein
VQSCSIDYVDVREPLRLIGRRHRPADVRDFSGAVGTERQPRIKLSHVLRDLVQGCGRLIEQVALIPQTLILPAQGVVGEIKLSLSAADVRLEILGFDFEPMPRAVRHLRNLSGERQVAALSKVMQSKHDADAPKVTTKIISAEMLEHRRILDEVIRQQDAFGDPANDLSIGRGWECNCK